jgi:crotonobetainyl-CoA:carnitine CoA-transferase CaiB-like acyl-CoA transferase
MAHVVRTADGTVLGAGRLDARQLGTGPLERLYETADGWICLVVGTDEEFERLCDALAADELRDAHFASAGARAANASALADMLSAAFATRTTANVIAALTNRRVPATEVAGYNNRAFMDDPSNLANGRVAECVHPEEGLIRELALLVRVSGAATPPHRLAPNLGEHTDAVLASFGYSDERIQSMRARGVVQ